MSTLPVLTVVESITQELEVKEGDLMWAMNAAPSYREREPVLEEIAFVERVRDDVGALVAEIESRDTLIELLRAQLADYHEKPCELLTFDLERDGNEVACTCNAAPPLLNISDFADAELEAVVVSPNGQSGIIRAL